jgi:drug/metabolite transporter (DMT)-like permease
LDIFANLGYYIALNFLPGSVYQMLRGGNLIATYLLSYALLGTKFRKYRTFGCIIMFFGLLLIGVVNLAYTTDSQSEQQYTLLGYGLIFFSLIINAFHYIYEEYLTVNYNLEPFLIIGLEGIYGIIISLIMIPLLSTIPCFLKQDACVINDNGIEVV